MPVAIIGDKNVRTQSPGIALGVAAVLICHFSLSADGQTATRPQAPLSEEACREWALKIEKTVNAGNPSFLDASLDLEALAEAATRGINAPEPYVRGFRQGVKQSRTARFGQAVCAAISQGGMYKLLRLRKANGGMRALFRMTGGGVNYHDVSLAASPDGRIVIADIYVHMAGESLSGMFRRMAAMGAAEFEKAHASGRVQEKGEETVQGFRKLAAFAALVQAGLGREALAKYQELPAFLKNEKATHVIRIAAAAKAGEKAYLEAMADFRKRFPNDPAADLIATDWLFMKRRFRQAREAIDRVDRVVGPDPYLNYLRAVTYMEAGDLDTARKLMIRTVQAEPGLLEGHMGLATVSLKTGDFKQVRRSLTRIEDDLGADMEEQLRSPQLAEFLKSAEGRAYLKSRREKRRAAPSIRKAD